MRFAPANDCYFELSILDNLDLALEREDRCNDIGIVGPDNEAYLALQESQ